INQQETSSKKDILDDNPYASKTSTQTAARISLLAHRRHFTISKSRGDPKIATPNPPKTTSEPVVGCRRIYSAGFEPQRPEAPSFGER
ncbi:MAG: hypothetical protein ACK5YI_04350, partial [Rhodospirillales bacterium]